MEWEWNGMRIFFGERISSNNKYLLPLEKEREWIIEWLLGLAFYFICFVLFYVYSIPTHTLPLSLPLSAPIYKVK